MIVSLAKANCEGTYNNSVILEQSYFIIFLPSSLRSACLAGAMLDINL